MDDPKVSKADLRSILLHPELHSREVFDAAVRDYYPRTAHAPPQPPPDRTPAARDIVRYPRQYANQPGVYAAALREVLGIVIPPEGLDVTTPDGAANWARIKGAAEKAGIAAGEMNTFFAEFFGPQTIDKKGGDENGE